MLGQRRRHYIHYASVVSMCCVRCDGIIFRSVVFPALHALSNIIYILYMMCYEVYDIEYISQQTHGIDPMLV